MVYIVKYSKVIVYIVKVVGTEAVNHIIQNKEAQVRMLHSHLEERMN